MTSRGLRSFALLLSGVVLGGCPVDDATGVSGGGDTEDDTDPSTGSGAGSDTMSTSTTATTTPSTTTDTPTTTTDPSDTDPSDTDTDTGGTPATIYDVQMGNIPAGTIVTISDVVVTSPIQMEQGGVTVQEQDGGEYSAIYLFMFTDVVSGVSLSPGDVVTFTGEYTEYFDFSEITIGSADDIVVTGTADVPAPELVTAADIAVGGGSSEAYESVLVRVEDLVASDATNRFGDVHVDDDLVITNFFLFEQGGALDVLPGTTFDFVQGPLLYNFEEFKVAPRTSDDVSATAVPCADVAAPATISEVQQGMFAEDELVLLEGVVVSTPLTYAGDSFWVQDPAGGMYSGISVFASDTGGLAVAPGDEVTICGAYTEFFEQSQIAITGAVAIESTGTVPVPAPEVLASAEVEAEEWEGVLVQVDAPTVTAEADMFGEWEIDGTLLVTDTFFEMAEWPTPAVDDAFTTLTGVVEFSFDNYKLAPRDVDDIVPE